MMTAKQHIQSLLPYLTDGIHERDQVVAISLLAALSGNHTFLYGPPGTAKSLISRCIASAFAGNDIYFECLMNKFTTPEEVFGPISVKQLKEDTYRRITDYYLPTAQFAFLDEIWKASGTILNTLLTLLNERKYRNGADVLNAPLKAVISASNEIPEPGQGLEALYDRFLVRFFVQPMVRKQNFVALLNNDTASEKASIPPELLITDDQWTQWQNDMKKVTLSPETLTVICLLREQLARRDGEQRIYVSDRRWQRAADLLRASAFFNDRQQTSHTDNILLKHCLWHDAKDCETVSRLVEEAIAIAGLGDNKNISQTIANVTKLAPKIEAAIKAKDPMEKYDTVKTDNGIVCFKTNLKKLGKSNDEYVLEKLIALGIEQGFYQNGKPVVYIPARHMHSASSFKPLDKTGKKIKFLKCCFHNSDNCKITLAS